MKIFLTAAFTALALFTTQNARAEADLGKTAPGFMLTDSEGKTVELKTFIDKKQTVVLEWLNFECPFVRKHYDSGNMQKIQKDEIGKGTVWLSIISSAEGKQGFLKGKELTERMKKEGINASAVLLDTDGKVGQAYGAKTTPHMYIINSKGTLVYRGAIDDMPSTDKADIPKSKNYVTAALEDLRSNRKIASGDTKPYGCGVKYK